MKPLFTSILIISDIEGSSGCWDRKASAFKTKEWAKACVDMSLDVHAAATALFDAGAKHIRIKDFHRTGYNLLPEYIDKRAELVLGYKLTPIPAIGDPGHATGLIMLGMHASSGSKGFISHTLTSRIKRIECNGTLLSEAGLIAMVLADYGISPLFFSGCPVACKEAHILFPHIATYPIDKSGKSHGFDKHAWRNGLKTAVSGSIFNRKAHPFKEKGPFKVDITMRDGTRAAHMIARRWHLDCRNGHILFESPDPGDLLYTLLKIAYLNPFIEKIAGLGLFLFNRYGAWGQQWVRKQIKATL